MAENKINLNNTATFVSIIVGLASIGFFGWFGEKYDEIQTLVENAKMVSELANEVNEHEHRNEQIIESYIKQRKVDSLSLLRLTSTIQNQQQQINSLYNLRKSDSVYIKWNYNTIMWLRDYHVGENQNVLIYE